MFNFHKLVGGAANRFSGKTDFLEAVAAAGAYMASTDGQIEGSEVEALLRKIANHPQLASFPQAEVERTVNTMIARSQDGYTGRAGLLKEVRDVASDAEKAETVFLVAIDITMADGELEPQERAGLNVLAKELRQDLGRIMAQLGVPA